MGILISDTDHTGLVVGKVTLGYPARDTDDDDEPTGPYRWADGLLPNGTIDADGTITLDEPETI